MVVLVHDSQIIDGVELREPILLVRHHALHGLVYKSVLIFTKFVLHLKIFQFCVLGIGDNLLL